MQKKLTHRSRPSRPEGMGGIGVRFRFLDGVSDVFYLDRRLFMAGAMSFT